MMRPRRGLVAQAPARHVVCYSPHPRPAVFPPPGRWQRFFWRPIFPGKISGYDRADFFMRSGPVPNGQLGDISDEGARRSRSGQVPHRPRERPMVIDWQRLADDDYYADVCTMVYETCQRGMLRYCVTRLGDALGTEVMQEVFVTMVKTLRTYRPGPPVESWLFGMAKQ